MFDVRDKVKLVVEYFQDKPVIKTELNYSSDYELLVAIILSAQCTDKRVNDISPKLFRKYNNFESLSRAEVNDIFEIIKSISYPKEKSIRLVEVSKIIHSVYKDIIPNDVNKLTNIKGIGRKTANLLLSILYDYEGIAVDTHVSRVANRLGLVDSKNPNIVEKELSLLFPKKLYNKINPWFVIFGRYNCKAIKPMCDFCFFKKICSMKS